MVVVVNVLIQTRSQLINALETLQVEKLRFERAEEAFHGRVVQAIAFSRHALLYPAFA
ncbi:hypothetical protein D3C80_1133390 [compost metagenome]